LPGVPGKPPTSARRRAATALALAAAAAAATALCAAPTTATPRPGAAPVPAAPRRSVPHAAPAAAAPRPSVAPTAATPRPSVAHAPAAATARPSVAACALGVLDGADRTAVPAALARAEARFAAGLRGVDPAARRRGRRALATAAAAFVYGIAPVTLRATVQRFPLNSIVGIAELAGPETRVVVAPNHDTTYSVARLELADGPLVVDLPDAGRRYAVLALLDAYTNDFAYLDARTAAGGARSAAIVPPGWRGTLPAGVRRVSSPTNLVWLLGRTLVDGEDDMPGARRVMAGHALTPLAAWTAGERRRALIIDAFPSGLAEVRIPRGIAFADALGASLAADPPPARDACALRAFATVGIGPGRTPSTETRDPVVRAALAAAPGVGAALVRQGIAGEERESRRRNNGWLIPGNELGRYGRRYLSRAEITRDGLGANRRREADYPRASSDSAGRPLDGRHRYVVRFERGELPPVRAFWSLTLYDRRSFLVRNPIDRYTVGDRTPGLRRGRDGSLTVYVQHRPPSAARRANWLPAPAGRFKLMLRLYEPSEAVLSGRWRPPPVRRVG
jgi:hypothetical protein